MVDELPETRSPMRAGHLQRLLDELTSGGVDFVVCGGVACLLHGVNRTTNDIDISVRLDDENLTAFVSIMDRLGFRPRLPEPLSSLQDPARRRAWIEEKGAKVVTLEAADCPFQVDVFLQYPVEHDELRAASSEKAIESVRFRVSSLEHLIFAKRAVEEKRKVDLRDIEDLEELRRRAT